MKTRLLLLAVVLGLTTILKAQSTYTWKVASGDWRTASNWNPSRTSPAANDILVFNGSTISTAIVDSIPREIIGKLRIINNATVKFNSGLFFVCSGTISRASTTVTGTGTAFLTETKVGEQIYVGPPFVSGNRLGEISAISSNTTMTMGSGPVPDTTFGLAPSIIVSGGDSSLEVQNGSSLVLNSTTAPVSIYVDAGSKGIVSGKIFMQKGQCRVFAADSISMIFKNGATVRTDSSFTGNPFTLVGKQNTHVFQAGSTFEVVAGANPFGLAAPASKVIFNAGSNYVQLSTSGFSVSGRKFANLICRAASALTASGGGGFNTDSLIVETNTLNITATGTGNSIKGDIRVASGATLNFNSASPTIHLNGTSIQKISGGGTITFTQPIVLDINNTVQLNRNLDIKDSRLILHGGYVFLNGNTFTIGASASAPGSLQVDTNTYFGGFLDGTLTRWFGTKDYALGLDTALFPMLEPDFYLWQYVWIGGTPSTGGTVSVKYNYASHENISFFDTPFNDNATNNVLVNVRTDCSWTISTGNGFAGSDIALRIGHYPVVPLNVNHYIDNATNIRITLASGIAPGTAVDGALTNTFYYAQRTDLSATNLNNTFHIGADFSENPLPAKLIYFKGQVINNNKDAQIEWATASEVNVDYFAVLGSNDGVHFNQTVAMIYANKNANGVKTYSVKDVNAFENTRTKYYRLYTKDIDGSDVYSEVITLNNYQIITNNQQVAVFPNPVLNDVNIQFEKPLNGQLNISVIDMQGKEVYKTSFETNNASKLSFPLNNLNAGIYFMQISGNEVYQTLKIKKD